MSFIEVSYYISIFSGLLILILSVSGYILDDFDFWPPPSRDSWQFKLFWLLFLFFVSPLLLIIVTKIDERNSNNMLFFVGGSISLIGLILGNVISYQLGVKNSSGLKDGLVTKGWFAISRNPIYVVTMISLIGTMIAFPIVEVISISTLWIFLYLLAPFVEEPWLIEKYGEEYIEYKKRVRRFI